MDGGEEEEGDPFAWISEHCRVSSSQEEMLRNAPYVLPNLAPGDDDEDEGTPVAVISDSSSAEGKSSWEEEFRTPPERHPLTSPNEAVDCGGAQDEDMDMEKTADLTPEDSEVFGIECCRLNMSPSVLLLQDEDGYLKEMDEEITRGVVEPLVEGGSPANAQRTSGLAENASLKLRKLPAYFYTSFQEEKQEEDVAAVNEQGSCRASAAEGDGGVHFAGQGDSRARNSSGDEIEEPTEDELTENLLKVLGLLAKPLRPVYKEKVDIIGSAIRAGITFPRPSWYPEDSDDDNSS